MIVEQTRFGAIEYTIEDVITFDQGLIGFPSLRRFLNIATREGSSFRWLQSLDETTFAVLVTDPVEYVSDYAPESNRSLLKSLEIHDDTPYMVFTTANIPPGKPNDMTLNLSGPILINLVSRQAKQIVLDDPAYTTKYRVFQEADRQRGKAVA